MKRTTSRISKMDCPSDEQMIRMKLNDLAGIQFLDFDIPERLLHVYHTESEEAVFQCLESLKLDTSFVSTEEVDHYPADLNEQRESKILRAVLIINFSFFTIEIITGFIAKSMGLVADSLDMLADSIVYGLALLAVGGTVARKKKIAGFAGYFQITLAVIGLVEVIRRFMGSGYMPDFRTMVIVSALALMANAFCLYLLQKSKSKEVHMRATMIFTSNDIIINAGVIIAGLLVHWLRSGYPDLIIGAVVFLIVARGAGRILQLSK